MIFAPIRLRDRLIAALVLVLLVPMGASLLYITTTVRQNVIQESAAQLRDELNEKGLQIQYALESLSAEHFILSRVPSVALYARSSAAEDAAQQREQVEQLFAGIIQAFPLNREIRLLRDDGREILRVQRDDENNVLSVAELRDRSGTQEYLKGMAQRMQDMAIVPVTQRFEDGRVEHWLTLIRRLSAADVRSGLLALDVDLDRLFTPVAVGAGQVIVLDEEGRVLFSAGSGSMMNGVSSGVEYRTFYPETAELIVTGADGVLVAPPDQPDQIVAFDEVVLEEERLRWRLVSTRALDDVLEQVAAQEVVSVVILGGAIMIALLVGLGLTASMLRPMMQLKESMGAAAQSDWDRALKLARSVPPGDELGDLAEAISSMTQELAVIYTALEDRVKERTMELERANARLHDMDQMKSKFIADVSHELRTPLSVMRLRITLLERRPEQAQRLLPMLEEQVMRMSQLVENILDVSRLDLAVNRTPFAPMEINQALSQVIDVHSALIHEKGLTLGVKLGEGLPSILGNYNQICQVLENLISNAVKYTLEGEIRVRSWYDPLRQRVGVTIEDTGIGISAEDLPRLFERFYRAASVSQSNIPGTGLGMAIVKEILDIHHGGIEIQSEIKQGTTINLWFPAEDTPGFIPA